MPSPGDALTRLERLPDEGGTERTGQPDAEHHGKAADLVLQSDPLADQLETSNNRAIWTKGPGIRLWRGRLVTAIGVPTRGRLG